MATKKAATRRVSRKSTPQTATKNKLVLIGIVFVVGLIVAGTAVFLGKSDSGVINVAQTIRDSNQRAIAEGDTATQAAIAGANARPDLAGKKNGGLVPQSGTVITPPEPPKVEKKASSTDSTATSTEAVASSTPETADDSEETETAETPSEDESVEEEVVQ